MCKDIKKKAYISFLFRTFALNFLSENHSQHKILGHGPYGLNNMVTNETVV